MAWEGCALPNPPLGEGLGKPGFPISQPLLGAAGAPQAGVRFDRLTAGGETRFPRIFTSVLDNAAPAGVNPLLAEIAERGYSGSGQRHGFAETCRCTRYTVIREIHRWQPVQHQICVTAW